MKSTLNPFLRNFMSAGGEFLVTNLLFKTKLRKSHTVRNYIKLSLLDSAGGSVCICSEEALFKFWLKSVEFEGIKNPVKDG